MGGQELMCDHKFPEIVSRVTNCHQAHFVRFRIILVNIKVWKK